MMTTSKAREAAAATPRIIPRPPCCAKGTLTPSVGLAQSRADAPVAPCSAEPRPARSFVAKTGRDGRETAVDVGDFAGDGAREIGEIERSDVAHLIDRDVPPQRRIAFDELQNFRESRDACGRQRLDRS